MLVNMKNRLQYKSPLSPGIEALSCENNFVFTSHIHNGHVLWLNSDGGEQYNLKGCSAILQPGSVSIIEPGVVHSNRAYTPGRRHLRSLYLNEDFFMYLEKLLSGETTGKLNLPTSVIENHECWRQAIFLHEAIITNQDQLLIDEHIVSFFSKIELLQCRKLAKKKHPDSSKDRIKILIEFMGARLSENISLDDLAEIGLCTSYHVIRLFRNLVGMSPHAYLVQLRLEKARELITSGLSISDAALLAGFSDQSHLTRKFKKRYGLTPGLYGTQKLSG